METRKGETFAQPDRPSFEAGALPRSGGVPVTRRSGVMNELTTQLKERAEAPPMRRSGVNVCFRNHRATEFKSDAEMATRYITVCPIGTAYVSLAP